MEDKTSLDWLQFIQKKEGHANSLTGNCCTRTSFHSIHTHSSVDCIHPFPEQRQ